ncbi:MAG: RluA family pseudouridine synthase [Proteobacteria bacterium]|nr:RluA family pseudouridine synthase [Pseudomonadota bacterium]
MTQPDAGRAEVDAEAEGLEPERRAWAVAADGHGQRLDKLLALACSEFSRNHLQGLVEAGHVEVDGQPCTHSARKLRAGQRIAVTLVPTAESQAFRAQPMALDIVYEDEHLLVVDKPAGLVVHPAAGNWSGTLLNGLLAHHGGAAALPRAGIVHRLDKDTSGLMVVGKTLPAVTALVRDIAAREVQRQYLAIAWGDVQPALQRIDAPVGRDPAARIRMAVLAGGRPAQTDVECLAVQQGFSALRCRLHTGRTHQIRVHLAWRGHPLVADALYGGKPALGLQRQALHAERLAFEHPVTRAAMDFQRDPPADFAAAWAPLAGAATMRPVRAPAVQPPP